jgi:hypothetical protein
MLKVFHKRKAIESYSLLVAELIIPVILNISFHIEFDYHENVFSSVQLE